MAWLPDGEKFSGYLYSFWRNSWTWQTHRQTDGRTDTAWQHRPSLCIASRGKNVQRKSCEFRLIRGFYVSISIQNILKGNLQPKFKGASVWPKSTHKNHEWIEIHMTCAGRFFHAMLCINAAYAVVRCLSVCLPRSWVASKRIKISSKIFTIG